MSLGNVREALREPPARDENYDNKRQGFRKYVSPWAPIDASGSRDFSHGLNEIPHVVSVLEATNSQGTSQAEASSVTVTRTATIVTVQNTGAARYFRVRAF